MPNPEQMRKAAGVPAVPSDPLGLGAAAPTDLVPPPAPAKPIAPRQTADPAGKILPVLGLSEADVAPGTGGANLETTPMPNTNPAYAAMGLGETDIAPGGSPPEPEAPVTPEKVVPVKAPVEPGAPITPPAKPGIVGKQAESKELSGPSGPVTAEDVSAKAQEAVQQLQKDPKLGDQFLQLAKDTGKSILELVQGFALGMARSDKPLASEVRQAQKMKELDIEAQKQRQVADQQFQQNLAKIQNDYIDRRFQATSAQDLAEAVKERDFKTQEAVKDRQARLTEAQVQRTPTNWEQMQYGYLRQGGLKQALAQIAESLKPGG